LALGFGKNGVKIKNILTLMVQEAYIYKYYNKVYILFGNGHFDSDGALSIEMKRLQQSIYFLWK